MNKKISRKDFIIGQKFVEISDIIFAANLPNDNFNKIKNNNYKIISQNNYLKSFKIKNFTIKSGDSIYCSSNHLEILFYYLKNVNKSFNLTLISGQSDRNIDEKIFLKKPKCIQAWYSTNVDFNDDILFPIPLGIANNYSPKNIRADDFLNYSKKILQKENKLYINLQKNTNSNERGRVYEIFKNKDWVVQKEPNLSIEEYLDDLNVYKFVLCPWGNGFDTHRFWEVLYSGSIPITKYHKTYESAGNLPVIFIDKFENINLDFLLKKSKELSLLNHDELEFKFWKDKISSKNILNNIDKIDINENKIYELFFWNKKKIVYKFKSRFKILNYYFKKVKKLFL